MASSVVGIDEPLADLELAEFGLVGRQSAIEFTKEAWGARAIGVRRGGVSEEGVGWWSGCSVMGDERWR
jgi:hypothetical protein